MISKNNIATFEVRVGDINYGGHMGNDKALLLFHDARIRFLESIGLSEKHIGDNAGIILNEAHVFYLKEIFLYDRLQASIAVTEVSTASFVLEYSFIREKDAVEVLKGSTKILAYDYDVQRVVKLPEVFAGRVRELETIEQ